MLELVAFICGAAVMVMEMGGARLLAPHLGTSIVVWTGLIGVVLASLSAGYWLGGRLADKKPSAGLLGCIIFIAACVVALMGLAHPVLLTAITGTGMSLYASAICAAALLFCLPGILLGMVSPYVIRVKIALGDIPAADSGAVIGRFFALSTIGSILGTFLGGFVLISVLGTRWILFSVAGALLFSSLLVLFFAEKQKKRTLRGSKNKQRRSTMLAAVFGSAFCGACALGTMWFERQAAAGGLISVDTRYNHIQVLDEANNGSVYRYMITDPGKFQSSVDLNNPDSLSASYTRFFALSSLYQPHPENVLMLGGGGYTVPRRILFEADNHPPTPPASPVARVDVVEIDPGMTEVARRYFFLRDDPRLHIFHEDARIFLNRRAAAVSRAPENQSDLYDVVLLDTFNSHYAIPFHLCTVESMRAVHSLLTDSGVVAMNIISSINGDTGRLFRSIYASVKAVFPEVRVFTVHAKNPDIVQNIMLLAAKSEAVQTYHPLLHSEHTAPIAADMRPLTDNFAPIERYALYD